MSDVRGDNRLFFKLLPGVAAPPTAESGDNDAPDPTAGAALGVDTDAAAAVDMAVEDEDGDITAMVVAPAAVGVDAEPSVASALAPLDVSLGVLTDAATAAVAPAGRGDTPDCALPGAAGPLVGAELLTEARGGRGLIMV